MFLANLLTQDLYLYENEDASGLDWDHLSLLRGVSAGKMVRLPIERKEPLRAELEAFVAAASSQESDVVGGEDALATLELAQAFVESGKECRVIEFAERGTPPPETATEDSAGNR
jgi:predicted dehydrogenase